MKYYFAYGSNLKTERLVKRVGEVIIYGKASYDHYQLIFNKLGDDGSGKANIKRNKNSNVEGVLFGLTKKQFDKLDENEGCDDHYIRRKRKVKYCNKKVKVEVYIANKIKIKNYLKPTCDYRQYIIDGAKEHNLSRVYREFIESFECF
jgi:gamma-glutamylcyclotransferase (GGCT)/AIG2-like uncharacterized protein YtfP